MSRKSKQLKSKPYFPNHYMLEIRNPKGVTAQTLKKRLCQKPGKVLGLRILEGLGFRQASAVKVLD